MGACDPVDILFQPLGKLDEGMSVSHIVRKLINRIYLDEEVTVGLIARTFGINVQSLGLNIIERER